MRNATPGAIFLKDYRAPDFLINRTELHFELGEDQTLVTSRLHLLHSAGQAGDELVLHGQDLDLQSVSIGMGLSRKNLSHFHIGKLGEKFTNRINLKPGHGQCAPDVV